MLKGLLRLRPVAQAPAARLAKGRLGTYTQPTAQAPGGDRPQLPKRKTTMPTDIFKRDAAQAPKTLQLDPKHPGIADPEYVARRRTLHDLAHTYRLEEKGWPKVAYTDAENKLWSTIAHQLVEAHARRACSIYNRGRKLLEIDLDAMPQLGELDKKLQAQHQFGLVPAEGLLDVTLFFRYLKERRMPCTQFMRHPAVPQFTPEPDAVHDVIGHVPCLMDKDFTDVVQRIGEGVLGCEKKYTMQWSRLYWFTVEFGLIEENGEQKVMGAGLLSSLEEIDYCFSDKVQRRPFVLEDVITCKYDPSRMQDTVFVVPSLPFLIEQVDRLKARQAAAA
jgi:phenylalanine-4-hydroxylase